MGVIRPNLRKKGNPTPPIEAVATIVQRHRFLNYLRQNPIDKKGACLKAGIRVVNLPRILEECPDFKAEYDEIQAGLRAAIEQQAIEEGKRPGASPASVKMALQIIAPGEYGSVGGGVNVTVNITPDQLKEMTTEELQAYRCRLLKSS